MNHSKLDWDEVFVRDARKPVAWRLSADQLRRVAIETWGRSREALEQQLEWAKKVIEEEGEQALSGKLSPDRARQALDAQLHNIAFMLAGFAVENLAKGILISRDPSLVDESEGIASRLRTHDLQSLVSKCLGSLSRRENVVLEEVATLTRWRGRYPVPLASEAFRNHKKRVRKRGRTTGQDKEGDWRVLGEIYRRLEKELVK